MKDVDSLATNTGHAVIILASGLSQRLGTSKQLLTYQGQSLLQIMLNRALATHPQAVVVVIPDKDSTIIKSLKTEINRVVDSCDSYSGRVQIVTNDCPQSGMGHSLYLGIERLKQLHQSSKYYATNNSTTKNATGCFERVILMGVDQVLLDSSHLKALLAVNNKVVASGYAKDYNVLSTTTDNTVDQTSESIMGLPIALSFKQLVDWQSQLSGDVGLRYLLRALPADDIATVDNLSLSLDIDTPQQQQFAIEQGWLDP